MSLLSINELTTYRWRFEDDVAGCIAAGIPAIGVWRQKLSDYGEEKGIELLAESGLKVSNLLWGGGFTGSDGRTFRESIDDALEAVQLAAALGAGCLVVYSGARAGHTHNHARRLFRDAVKEILPLATELKVTLAVEPMHPGCASEWTFLTSIDETLEQINQFDSPYVRLAFDTYHVGHEEGVVDRIGELVEKIAIVHLGDAETPPQREQNRAQLGDGRLPLKQIVHALSAASYQGCYDVELVGEQFDNVEYTDVIERSKRAFARLLDHQTV